jgi:hypothetical protein
MIYKNKFKKFVFTTLKYIFANLKELMKRYLVIVI